MKPLAAIALLLSASSVFAAADLRTAIIASDRLFRAGFHYSSVRISVTNFGTDTAVAVQFSVTSSVPISCVCWPDDIPPGQNRERFIQFDAPATSGPLIVTASATSSTPDANPNDNTVSVALSISADPDVVLSLAAPLTVDLGVPFTLTIQLGNASMTTAHDVDITVDLPAGVSIRSLPAGCSSPASGRVACRLDELGPRSTITPFLALILVAPSSYGSGSIAFSAAATEREPDFEPRSNSATLTVALYQSIYVTTTADSGSGSLRQAIADANATCLAGNPCTIAFRIEEPSATGWKSIRVASPLPALVAPRLRITGATQSGFFGDRNVDGPEIEISGGGTVEGDGLVVGSCGAEVANLAVNGFGGNGVSVVLPDCDAFPAANLHHLFVGTDPTGSAARPNLRGIGTALPNGTLFFNGPGGIGDPVNIHDCVVSGNLRSGIFGLSGRLNVSSNRIGVKAHADEPLPNGNAGVYVGPGGYGSDIGPDVFAADSASPTNGGNVIAFNGQMGVAVAAGVRDVAIRNNRIWGNGGLGIDVGLDGPTLSSGNAVSVPALTLAHYDPSAKQTVIEGDFAGPVTTTFAPAVDFFANDAPDPSGHGEGQRPLGHLRIMGAAGTHFRFTADGDLTGQFVAATTTRYLYAGFAKPGPKGVDQGFLTQTSEFSRAIEVR
ncbi:MAG: hypothetical protein AABO58_05615 [Acidobacteriota bacterium]